jgi:hypothetical protein
MPTSKSSTSNVKNGPNREKGLAHFESLLAWARSNNDTILALKYEAIIKRIESDIQREKSKNKGHHR